MGFRFLSQNTFPAIKTIISYQRTITGFSFLHTLVLFQKPDSSTGAFFDDFAKILFVEHVRMAASTQFRDTYQVYQF